MSDEISEEGELQLQVTDALSTLRGMAQQVATLDGTPQDFVAFVQDWLMPGLGILGNVIAEVATVALSTQDDLSDLEDRVETVVTGEVLHQLYMLFQALTASLTPRVPAGDESLALLGLMRDAFSTAGLDEEEEEEASSDLAPPPNSSSVKSPAGAADTDSPALGPQAASASSETSP